MPNEKVVNKRLMMIITIVIAYAISNSPSSADTEELNAGICSMEAQLAGNAMKIRQGNRLGQRDYALSRFDKDSQFFKMLELAYTVKQEADSIDRQLVAIHFSEFWFESCMETLP